MLKEKINADLLLAMKQKNTTATITLREVKAKITETETVKNASVLDDDGVLKVVRKVISEKQDSIAMYHKGDRLDLVDIEKNAITLLETFLPAQMTSEQLNLAISDIITTGGYSGIKDMGKVIKDFATLYSGKADNKSIAETAKAKL